MDPVYEKEGVIMTNTIEVCAEVIHILCKIKRFGWFNYHPDDKNKVSNILLVEKELADLENKISKLRIEIYKQKKGENIIRETVNCKNVQKEIDKTGIIDDKLSSAIDTIEMVVESNSMAINTVDKHWDLIKARLYKGAKCVKDKK